MGASHLRQRSQKADVQPRHGPIATPILLDESGSQRITDRYQLSTGVIEPDRSRVPPLAALR